MLLCSIYGKAEMMNIISFWRPGENASQKLDDRTIDASKLSDDTSAFFVRTQGLLY